MLFGDVATPEPGFRNSSLSDVEALVFDPLAAVAVRVFKAKVVVLAQLLREDVVCKDTVNVCSHSEQGVGKV